MGEPDIYICVDHCMGNIKDSGYDRQKNYSLATSHLCQNLHIFCYMAETKVTTGLKVAN